MAAEIVTGKWLVST